MNATPIRIGYQSETASDYAKAIGTAATLGELREVVTAYRAIAEDAKAIADAMSEDDFKVWRKGLAKERRGVFAGKAFVEKYGQVIMPDVMIRVAAVASQYHVPFGVAYLRMKEFGQLDDEAQSAAK